MAKEIIWSPRAAGNLEDICGYIAKNSKQNINRKIAISAADSFSECGFIY